MKSAPLRWTVPILTLTATIMLLIIAVSSLPQWFGAREEFLLYKWFGLSRSLAAKAAALVLVTCCIYWIEVRSGLFKKIRSALAQFDAAAKMAEQKKSAEGTTTAGCLPIFVMVACSSLLCFFALELSSYIFFPSPRRTERVEPFVAIGGEPFATFDVNTVHNAIGYNGKMPERRAGEYPIFILGGSTVWYGKPSIASALEEIAHRNGHPQVAVYNFGVAGANSAGELARLVHQVIDYKPGMVIFYDGGNDIVHPASYMDPRPCAPFNQIIREWNPFDSLSPHTPSRIMMFLSSSRFLYRGVVLPHLDFFFELDDLRRQVNWGTDGWREKIADCYLSNHAKAETITHAVGAAFHGVFQPLLAYAAPDDPRSTAAEHSSAMRAIILQRAHARNLLLHDMSMIFSDSEDKGRNAFLDWVHVRQEVHPYIAQKIFAVIESDLPRGVPLEKSPGADHSRE